MENQEKRQIIKAIYEYLTLMPNAAYYNICRQQETKKVLEFLVSRKDGLCGDKLNVKMLQEHLEFVKKWDGVTHEPDDPAFQLLLLDVQANLKRIRTNLLDLTPEHDAEPS